MCACVRACTRAEVCVDCALVLCFVMGYVLQFGEVEHKRVLLPDLVCFEVQCLPRSAHLKIFLIFVILMTSF